MTYVVNVKGRYVGYPDVKAIVCGFFEPQDNTRCLVCGADLAAAGSQESTCSNQCSRKMCEIQRQWTEEDCVQLMEAHGMNADGSPIKNWDFGDQLPNGAVVIAKSGTIVLARYGNEFVVWQFITKQGEVDCGSYFDNIIEAASCYARWYLTHLG